MSGSVLEAARAGDERAFRELTEPHLRELHVHCYRMLGSITDAEDVLQETLLAAWRGLDTFAGRASLRAWLYRIATNRCLNAVRDGKRRPPLEPVPPFAPPEPTRRDTITWLQPYPDAWLESGPADRYEERETISLAFVAALQRLPPRQTAALLLCDVLGYSPAEAAAMLDVGGTALKGLLQRARAAREHIDPPAAAADPAHDGVARRFAEAYVDGDVAGVIALLTDDAWLAMPPAPHAYQGPTAIAAFLRSSMDWRGPRTLRLSPIRVNGQPAFTCHLTEPGSAQERRTGAIVLTVSAEGRVTAITHFLDGELAQLLRSAAPAPPRPALRAAPGSPGS
ncbi:RNA polymerase subunit sigma-70 [Pseudonocardia sp. GCM10023141]|uniref:RNA polymerase subunit sigma-70 n=1 Tax=Pseudonocardia sp. GCM10023141 TaxID=3252653 RepID=UPI003621DEB8